MDWEEKHKELCNENPEEWKVKKGAEARVEIGLKQLEDGFQMALKENASVSEDVKNTVAEIKEMCEKKDKKDKARRGSGEKTSEGQRVKK